MSESGLVVTQIKDELEWLEMRKKCITSTEASGVCGMPKYGLTRWKIYMLKRGELEDDFEWNDRMRAGIHLEPAIASLASESMEINMVSLDAFMQRGTMGASFDFEVQDESSEYDRWLVEIKNVDGLIFRDQWGEDSLGRPVPPEHISLQVQHQLEVSGRSGCLLVVLVGGNDLKIVPIERDPEVGSALRDVCDAFWWRVENGEEPDPTGDDANLLATYYDVSPERVIDASHDRDLTDRIARYKQIGDDIKHLEGERAEIKAFLLHEIEDAAKVVCGDGYTLDAGYTRGSEPKIITADMVGTEFGGRKGFRRFTVRRKKA